MQFSLLTYERVRLLLWGELFHCGILVWRWGTKILPCDPNKTQSSPNIVTWSSTAQVLGQCFSLGTCLCTGKCCDVQVPGDVCLGLKSREDFDLGFALEANYFLSSGCLCSVFHCSPPDSSLLTLCQGVSRSKTPLFLLDCADTHTSEFPEAREVSLVPLELVQGWHPACWSQWVLAVQGQGCPPCKVPLLACVQLTAVLCYKGDWFFNSLKDIWGNC